MKFPEHKAGLYLTHNEHKDYYQPIDEFIIREDISDSNWATPDSREWSIATDNIWSLQWYPETPVGFLIVYGATLEEVLEAANAMRPEEE